MNQCTTFIASYIKINLGDGSMLNIVIPMAGKGSRFAENGYTLPKPLIEVHGKPMIQVVVENLSPNTEHRFIFICQNEHIKKYDLATMLKKITKDPIILGIDGVTEGQVCTVLKAVDFINNDQPLMTANSDQFIDFDINEYLNYMENNKFDGLIMTMDANDPKWSFVKKDANGLVIETAEKKVISNEATVGIFNFRMGKYLVDSATAMIKDNVRVNNEFYTCPCYNYLIQQQKRIGTFSIGAENNGMYGLGIPADLNNFLVNPISRSL